jgi:hypothetical protein
MLRALLYHLQRVAMPAEFAIGFAGGTARVARGSPPAGWIADCGDLAREFGLEHGRIDAVRVAGRLQLRFSPDVPRALHQRFRNVFGTYSAARGGERRRR